MDYTDLLRKTNSIPIEIFFKFPCELENIQVRTSDNTESYEDKSMQTMVNKLFSRFLADESYHAPASGKIRLSSR